MAYSVFLDSYPLEGISVCHFHHLITQFFSKKLLYLLKLFNFWAKKNTVLMSVDCK